jgi:hypothetical protein
MPNLASGAGALVTVVATSSWLGGAPPPAPPPVVPATRGGAIFDHWAMDDESIFSENIVVEPNCSFWNSSVVYTSELCSHFSLSRIATGMTSRAVDRAVKCAAWHETDCVISPEVGVSIPAAFVYDPEHSGLRMVVAPRLIQMDSEVKTIRVADQTGNTNGFMREFNQTVKAEYLPGGSRTPVTEVFNGTDAYCIQMLRAAFDEDCWKALD